MVRFAYFKDDESDRQPQDVLDPFGAVDIARVDFIEIAGLSGFDSECSNCSPGFYQDEEGQRLCVPCPADTYQNHERKARATGLANRLVLTCYIWQNHCKECEPDEWAPQASLICYPREGEW